MMGIGPAEVFSIIWLGILTSISPCPLATNIAATSYIGQQIHSRFSTVLAAVAYTFGRALCYMLISAFVVAGLISIPWVSNFLQLHMNRILGPILLFAGLLILELIPFRLPAFTPGMERLQKLSERGFFGAVLIGFLFAMSFCPVSAALFFGSVIPLALKFQSRVFLPFLYGVGTTLPVIGSAFIMAYSTRFAGIFFNRLSLVECWLRRITGGLFVLIGGYFCLKYIFRLINF
jgi:hypothetical protein